MKSFLTIIVLFCMVSAYGEPPPPTAKATDIVYILGEIRVPQVLTYTPDLTVRGAIGAAGGISEFAPIPIYVIRDGAIFLKTSTRELRKTPSEDPKLKPKDIVYFGSIENAK